MIDRERLRREMLDQGITQAVLAQAVGVSPAAIQQILNGSTKNPRSLRDIAKALGISVDWLEGVSDQKSAVYVDDFKNNDLEPFPIQYFTTDFVKTDLETFKVARRLVLFSRSWLRSIISDIDVELILFRVIAKDLAPTILPGDDVLVASASAFDGQSGSLWMIDSGDRLSFRRITRRASGDLEMSADNPSVPTTVRPEDEVHIRGKLVWQGRSLIP